MLSSKIRVIMRFCKIMWVVLCITFLWTTSCMWLDVWIIQWFWHKMHITVSSIVLWKLSRFTIPIGITGGGFKCAAAPMCSPRSVGVYPRVHCWQFLPHLWSCWTAWTRWLKPLLNAFYIHAFYIHTLQSDVCEKNAGGSAMSHLVGNAHCNTRTACWKKKKNHAICSGGGVHVCMLNRGNGRNLHEWNIICVNSWCAYTCSLELNFVFML